MKSMAAQITRLFVHQLSQTEKQNKTKQKTATHYCFFLEGKPQGATGVHSEKAVILKAYPSNDDIYRFRKSGIKSTSTLFA